MVQKVTKSLTATIIARRKVVDISVSPSSSSHARDNLSSMSDGKFAGGGGVAGTAGGGGSEEPPRPGSSLDVGDVSKKAEKKRKREKQRRLQISTASEELAEILARVEPDESDHGGSARLRRRRASYDEADPDPGTSGLNTRLNLIVRASRALNRLHAECSELRQALEQHRGPRGDRDVLVMVPTLTPIDPDDPSTRGATYSMSGGYYQQPTQPYPYPIHPQPSNPHSQTQHQPPPPPPPPANQPSHHSLPQMHPVAVSATSAQPPGSAQPSTLSGRNYGGTNSTPTGQYAGAGYPYADSWGSSPQHGAPAAYPFYSPSSRQGEHPDESGSTGYEERDRPPPSHHKEPPPDR